VPYTHPPWPALPALPEGLGDEENLQHLLEQHRRYGIALRTKLSLLALERRKEENRALEQRLRKQETARTQRRAELQAQADAATTALSQGRTPAGPAAQREARRQAIHEARQAKQALKREERRKASAEREELRRQRRLQAGTTFLTDDPKALETIRQRRANGDTYQAIADSFGLSRERIRQLCAKHGFPGRRQGPNTFRPERLQQAKTLLDRGQTLGDTARQLGGSREGLHAALKREGYDFSAQDSRDARLTQRLEALQGQTFGAWVVVSGFELAPADGKSGRYRRSKVNCCCGDCGLTKLVSVSNLLAGRSQRCLPCAIRLREQRRRSAASTC